MGNCRSEFEQLLFDELIPAYCSVPKRNSLPQGFRTESLRLSEVDAGYFMRAWHTGIIMQSASGSYSAPASNATEAFFWEGRKALSPRPFTLWLEPIITFGGLARLHADHGWPIDRLGTQSVDWAFDIVAYRSSDVNEHIAGEVKKSVREIDYLLSEMHWFGENPRAADPGARDKRRNAFKKVQGLRARRAPVFWTLGPGGDSRVFTVEYADDEAVKLLPALPNVLNYEA